MVGEVNKMKKKNPQRIEDDRKKKWNKLDRCTYWINRERQREREGHTEKKIQTDAHTE